MEDTGTEQGVGILALVRLEPSEKLIEVEGHLGGGRRTESDFLGRGISDHDFDGAIMTSLARGEETGDGQPVDLLEDVGGEPHFASGSVRGKGVEVVHDGAVVDDLLDVAVTTDGGRVGRQRFRSVLHFIADRRKIGTVGDGIKDLLHLLQIEIITLEVGTVMDDFSPGLGLEAALPGRNERGVGDDLAGGIDRADVFENTVRNLIFRTVGHVFITAYYAEKCKNQTLPECGRLSLRECRGAVQ